MVSILRRSSRRIPLTTYPDDLKDVIQHLFEMQSAVHGYLGPETQQELTRKLYVTSIGD